MSDLKPYLSLGAVIMAEHETIKFIENQSIRGEYETWPNLLASSG